MQYDKMLAGLRTHLTPDSAAVTRRAHELWEAAGKPDGESQEFWFTAEKQIVDETANQIIGKVISPHLQEAAAQVQAVASTFASNSADQAVTAVKNAVERDMAILPDGVRFHRRVGSSDYIIVEEAPKVRTLLVDMAYHRNFIGEYGQDHRIGNHDHQSVRIALPYVVYGMRFHHGKINGAGFEYWFRKAPLKTLQDKMFLSHLPNTDGHGRPCVPWEDTEFGGSLAEQIKHAIQFFWSTEFNFLLHSNTATDERLKSFQAWEKATVENPLFVLDAAWCGALTNTPQRTMVPNSAILMAEARPVIAAEGNKFVKAASDILKLEVPKVEKKVPIPIQMPGTLTTISFS